MSETPVVVSTPDSPSSPGRNDFAARGIIERKPSVEEADETLEVSVASASVAEDAIGIDKIKSPTSQTLSFPSSGCLTTIGVS